ncbi:MAG: hypothetical protein ACI8T1_003724 [Verrucomicrobiales bacterium]|jgi:hypothetical protein
MHRFLLSVILLSILGCMAARGEDVRFSREVLPILSDRCFHCHGPDEGHRKADLRLDLEASARKVISSGEFLHRIRTKDPEGQMPPPDSHREPLSSAEVALLARWIDQGAPWGKHWAFEKPRRPEVPNLAKHPIDAFVRKRLEDEGLAASSMAEPHTLLRRLSFDLTGLPPAAEDVEAFDLSAYETTVERLLESSHHGERLAMWWLDAARYADTDGFQADAERNNWPWRDWVLEAFNANMPFDQFTKEQFAGDLLPEATAEQILATCFHRNHMTNGEGGRHPEESRIDYVIDRVNTMGTVWLGLTLGCTQCHSHKFDPISHEDYYSLFAFFDSIDEDGKAGSGATPYLKYQSKHAQRAIEEMETLVAASEPLETKEKDAALKRFEAWLKAQQKTLTPDFEAWKRVVPKSLESAEGTELQVEEQSGIVQAYGPNPIQDDYRIRVKLPEGLTRISGWKLEVLPHVSHTDGKLSRGSRGEFILTNVKLLVRKLGQSQVRDIEMDSAVASSQKEAKGRNYGNVIDTLNDDPRNGWTTEGSDPTQVHTAVFALAEPLELAADEEMVLVLYHRSTDGDANIGRFRIAMSDQAGEAVRSLKQAPLGVWAATGEAPNEALRKRLLAQYLVDDEPYQKVRKRLAEAKRQRDRVKKSAGEMNVMVLSERNEPRQSYVLERGVWDAKGKEVKPRFLPAVLPWSAEKTPSRLDLAQWLISPENPLTARVIVNHLWQMMFGGGLVRTPEDFGLQGEQPTHPKLLDWLAVEFIENGWDLRHLMRLMVTSETYQQSSTVTASMLERDPKNLLLTRATRYRLPAWMIRDGALAVSGLLNPALGGPPVKPYQPDGVWFEMFMGRFRYEPSIGPAQYRRTLYAYWRRTAAPTFLFDSSQRRVCEVGARRTNTPLQALTLLNDVTMLESSRALAEALPEIDRMAFQVLSRTPTDDERRVLQREYARALAFYQTDSEAASELVTVGQAHPIPDPELAARMVVASMLLNLDEAITHE